METSAGEPDWLDVPNARQTFAVHVEVDHPAGIYRGPPAGPDARGELMHVKVTSEKEGSERVNLFETPAHRN